MHFLILSIGFEWLQKMAEPFILSFSEYKGQAKNNALGSVT